MRMYGNLGQELSIYNEPDVPVVYLNKKETIHGVEVYADTLNGHPVSSGSLVTLTDSGLKRHQGVNASLPFARGDYGEVGTAKSKKQMGPERVALGITGKAGGPKIPTKQRFQWNLAFDFCPDGCPRLYAVDTATGERVKDGNILKFLPSGRIYRYVTVNPILSLPLDTFGRVRWADNY